MECSCRVSRRLRSIFHIICVAAYHARRCDEGEAAAAVGLEAESHHIGAAGAAGVRQSVVFSCLESVAASVELVSLGRVGDSASTATASSRPASAATL